VDVRNIYGNTIFIAGTSEYAMESRRIRTRIGSSLGTGQIECEWDAAGPADDRADSTLRSLEARFSGRGVWDTLWRS